MLIIQPALQSGRMVVSNIGKRKSIKTRPAVTTAGLADVLRISSDVHPPNEKRLSLVLQAATAHCATGKIFVVSA